MLLVKLAAPRRMKGIHILGNYLGTPELADTEREIPDPLREGDEEGEFHASENPAPDKSLAFVRSGSSSMEGVRVIRWLQVSSILDAYDGSDMIISCRIELPGFAVAMIWKGASMFGCCHQLRGNCWHGRH